MAGWSWTKLWCIIPCYGSEDFTPPRTWYKRSWSPNTEKMSAQQWRCKAEALLRGQSTGTCYQCLTSLHYKNCLNGKLLPKWQFDTRRLIAEVAGMWWMDRKGGEIKLHAYASSVIYTINFLAESFKISYKLKTTLITHIYRQDGRHANCRWESVWARGKGKFVHYKQHYVMRLICMFNRP